jgi:hypothetical protein
MGVKIPTKNKDMVAGKEAGRLRRASLLVNSNKAVAKPA